MAMASGRLDSEKARWNFALKGFGVSWMVMWVKSMPVLVFTLSGVSCVRSIDFSDFTSSNAVALTVRMMIRLLVRPTT